MSDFNFYIPPQPVGGWVLDPPDNPTGAGPCILFSVFRKPTEQQIKNTEETFGWKWRNYE